MNNLVKLCSELKEALNNEQLTLPNNKVTAVDVNDFIKNVLKTDKIEFTNAVVNCTNEEVSIEGNFTLFGLQIRVAWVFKLGKEDDILWKFSASTREASKVSALLDHFMNTKLALPVTLSTLELTGISFGMKSDSSFILQGNTSWGLLNLFTQKNEGVWESFVGITVLSEFSLSEIDATLSVFDALTFSNAQIVISDVTDPKFSIGPYSGVEAGVTFRSHLRMASGNGKNNSALSLIISELPSSLQHIDMIVEMDLSQTEYRLKAMIEDSFSLPNFSSITFSGVGLIFNTLPSISILGGMNFPITIPASPTVHSLKVEGALSFTYSETTGTVSMQATLNSDTEIIEPFKFYGVTLTEVGVGLDVSLGAESGIGATVEGGFLLNKSTIELDDKFAITTEVTDGVVNYSLLYCDTKHLSLSAIFDSLIEGPKLPNLFQDFSFDELSIYWCDKAQVLPDGTPCQVGYGYNAAIDIWGFHTYSALMIHKETGIAGQLSIDPINVLDGKITVEGNGQAGHGVKAGGPCFNFDTSKDSIKGSLEAKILGLTANTTQATLSSTSLEFEMDTNSVVGIEDSVKVAVKDGGKNIGFETNLNIYLDTDVKIGFGGMTLGSLRLSSTNLIGTLICSYNGGKLSVLVKAGFNFWGTTFKFDYDLGAELGNLNDLHKVVSNKLLTDASTIFKEYFSHIGNYINALSKNYLKGGDFVMNVLHGAYKNTIPEIFINLSKLHHGYHVKGQLDFPLKFPLKVPSVKFPIKYNIFNKKFPVVGRVKVGINKNFTAPGFQVNLLDLKPSDSVDFIVPISVYAYAKSPEFKLPEVSVGVKYAKGGVSFSGHGGIEGDFLLTNINFKERVFIQGEADGYVHVKIPVIGYSHTFHKGFKIDRIVN